MLPPRMSMPKKYWMINMMAQALATTARPTRAAVIRSRASCVLPLSPPEVIHWMPPQIRNMKTRRAETRRAPWMTPWISVPILVIATPSGFPIERSGAPGAAAEAFWIRLNICFLLVVLVYVFIVCLSIYFVMPMPKK